MFKNLKSSIFPPIRQDHPAPERPLAANRTLSRQNEHNRVQKQCLTLQNREEMQDRRNMVVEYGGEDN